jgi:hypothetical protein
MGILTDSAIIAYKSPIVISKRLLKFAKGGRSAPAEAVRMGTEKVELAAISAWSLGRGRSLESVVKNTAKKSRRMLVGCKTKHSAIEQL